jgi:hypothetical protein
MVSSKIKGRKKTLITLIELSLTSNVFSNLIFSEISVLKKIPNIFTLEIN